MNRVISSAIAVSAITISSIFGLSLVKVQPVLAQSKTGCTYVPDKPLGFPFDEACNSHDKCYDFSEVPKSSCDESFKRELLSICDQFSGLKRRTCRGIASLYRLGLTSTKSIELFQKARQKSGRPAPLK